MSDVVNDTIYKCNLCQKILKTKNSLITHIKNIHKDKPELVTQEINNIKNNKLPINPSNIDLSNNPSNIDQPNINIQSESDYDILSTEMFDPTAPKGSRTNPNRVIIDTTDCEICNTSFENVEELCIHLNTTICGRKKTRGKKTKRKIEK